MPIMKERKLKRPRVLILGARDAGKTSIYKVVFEGLAASDTLFIEPQTTDIEDNKTSQFFSVKIVHLPGGPIVSSEKLKESLQFDKFDALIFVLDVQTAIYDMSRKVAMVTSIARKVNPSLQVELFLHKADGMSEEYRLDTLQSLRERITEEMFDLTTLDESSLPISFHLTSVYDATIYEALSKVVQKLLPEQAMLEQLLDILCQQCNMDKAFLFDLSTKVYIATDTIPVDAETHGICSDYIDLMADFNALYDPESAIQRSKSRRTVISPEISASNSNKPKEMGLGFALDDGKDTTVLDQAAGAGDVYDQTTLKMPLSHVQMANGTNLAQWPINDSLSLVALLKPHVLHENAAVVNMNVVQFRNAVLNAFNIPKCK